MSDTEPTAATTQSTAEELIKRSTACPETRTARNTWYSF